MSKRTIKVVDLLCDVGNWNDSLRSVQTDLAHYAATNEAPAAWVAETEDEMRRWSAKRDKALHSLKATMESLTAADVDLIRRRYQPDRLAGQLKAVGIEPRW